VDFIHYKKRSNHIMFFCMQRGKKIWLKWSNLFMLWFYFFPYFLSHQKTSEVSHLFILFKFSSLLHSSYTLFYHVFSTIILFSFFIIGNCECIRDEDCFKQKRDEDCHKEYCMIFFVHKCESYKCVCAGMFNWLYVY